jgi:hypothetical protein
MLILIFSTIAVKQGRERKRAHPTSPLSLRERARVRANDKRSSSTFRSHMEIGSKCKSNQEYEDKIADSPTVRR